MLLHASCQCTAGKTVYCPLQSCWSLSVVSFMKDKNVNHTEPTDLHRDEPAESYLTLDSVPEEHHSSNISTAPWWKYRILTTTCVFLIQNCENLKGTTSAEKLKTASFKSASLLLLWYLKVSQVLKPEALYYCFVLKWTYPALKVINERLKHVSITSWRERTINQIK